MCVCVCGQGDLNPINPKQVEKMLDKGTFGTVFKAWDTKHKQFVAVKV
jgi:predicted Ser/Thr protein kinase